MCLAHDHSQQSSLYVPDWVIPPDFPRQQALVHGIRELRGNVIKGGYEAIPKARDGNTTVYTKYLWKKRQERERESDIDLI